jgi:hypothetical protein
MTAVRHDVHQVIDVHICQRGTGMITHRLPFVFDAGQPYEVTVLVTGHGGTLARLTIPRADLDSGRYKHINRPGAQITTYPDVTDRRWMHIAVRADCGRTATLTVAVVDISTFLDPTYDLVPAGREPDFQLVPDDTEFDAWLRGLAGAA